MRYVVLILIFCWGCNQPTPKQDKPKIDTAVTKKDTARKTTWSEQIDTYNYMYFDYKSIKEPIIQPIIKGLWDTTNMNKIRFAEADTSFQVEVTQSNDTIFINHHPFAIRKLFPEDFSFASKEEEEHFLFFINFAIYKCYVFTFKAKTYLALYMFASYCSSMPTVYLAFFSLQNQRPKFLFSKRQRCENLDCFNDYNNDGVLDFANWDFGDSLRCISIYPDDRIHEDQNHFMLIRSDTTQPMGFPYLIRSREKWFE